MNNLETKFRKVLTYPELFGPIEDGLRAEGVITAAKTVICARTPLRPADAGAAAAILIALGQKGRADLKPKDQKLLNWLQTTAFPLSPADLKPKGLGQKPLPAVEDPAEPLPKAAEQASEAAIDAQGAGAAAAQRPKAVEAIAVFEPSKGPAPHLAAARSMTDADIGALAQRLLDQNGRPQPSSSTEKAAKPTIDDALVSQVLSAVRQLTPEERETPAALANPDAVRKYSFLANLLSAAYDNGGDVSPPLATAIIDTLADMGRAEAVNLLPHLASESRRVADAVLAAQAVFDTTVDVPQRTIDEISAPFAWPTPSGPCLPTADYTCGWAQWGLSAAMSLSSNGALIDAAAAGRIAAAGFDNADAAPRNRRCGTAGVLTAIIDLSSLRSPLGM